MTTLSARTGDLWGECIGSAKLCDKGTVKDDPRFTCGYACTGGWHVGPGQYIRCTDQSHTVAAATPTGTVWYTVPGPTTVSTSITETGCLPTDHDFAVLNEWGGLFCRKCGTRTTA